MGFEKMAGGGCSCGGGCSSCGKGKGSGAGLKITSPAQRVGKKPMGGQQLGKKFSSRFSNAKGM